MARIVVDICISGEAFNDFLPPAVDFVDMACYWQGEYGWFDRKLLRTSRVFPRLWGTRFPVTTQLPQHSMYINNEVSNGYLMFQRAAIFVDFCLVQSEPVYASPKNARRTWLLWQENFKDCTCLSWALYKKLNFVYSPDISTQHVINKQRGFLWISDISEDCRMHGIWENEMWNCILCKLMNATVYEVL